MSSIKTGKVLYTVTDANSKFTDLRMLKFWNWKSNFIKKSTTSVFKNEWT